MTKIATLITTTKAVHEFSDASCTKMPDGWHKFIGHFSLNYSKKLHEGVYEIKFDYEQNDFTHKYFLN